MENLPAEMSAVGFVENLPIEDPESLIDFRLPVPEPGPRDILVEVEAVSVNPVDVWVRGDGDHGGSKPRILGFDAAGTVVAAGDETSLFSVGDEVFYAGSIDRPGSNSEFQLVDERIVGRKPSNLDFAEAAALPLTSITAWESLFTAYGLGAQSTGTILVLGAAGGVGSVLIQLAKELTGLTVIASASRPESSEYALELGADHVVDHHQDLVPQIEALAPGGLEYVFSPHTQGMTPVFAEILAPRGEVVVIDRPDDVGISLLKDKSITWHWELMFTRPVFQTEDMIEQHKLLNQVAGMVEAGKVKTTIKEKLSPIDADTLKQAHARVESGGMVGKIVISN